MVQMPVLHVRIAFFACRAKATALASKSDINLKDWRMFRVCASEVLVRKA